MGTTMRLMMTRATLHCVGTACAFVVYALFPHGATWLRLATYGFVWIACAALYFGAHDLWQLAVDRVEDRMRELVREQLAVDDLRRYRRRLGFVTRYHQGNHQC